MSITTRARRGLATVVVGALASSGLVALATAPAQAAEDSVSDVQFRWGFSNEANNSAFAPGTVNLFSAGKLGNPGAGGQALNNADSGATWLNGTAAGWSAATGDVTIEKKQADSSYAAATWAGTKTSATGGTISPPTSSTYSDHQVVIDEGTGTIDPAANTASITWDGDFTVAFYSGMSFFYVSDPVLNVTADGKGTVKATVSGFGSDPSDPAALWEPLPEEEVTLANLSNVDVTATGLTTTPDYLGVAYDAGETGQAQATQSAGNAAYWGSFPQSFVDFQQKTGSAAYWYTSGGSVDAGKPTLPLQVKISPKTPEVTPSAIKVLPTGEHNVTVTGKNFLPSLSAAPANPAGLSTGGVYVALGRFAQVWKPSDSPSASPSPRPTIKQWWALPTADHALLGGQASSAIALTPEGDFSATFTVDKAVVDALETQPEGSFGIYTYTRKTDLPSFETYTPITFEKAAPTVTASGATSSTYGTSGSTVTATVTSPAGTEPSGAVTLTGAGAAVTKDLVDGKATFAVPANLAAGTKTLSFAYAGNANVATSTATRSLKVVAAKVDAKRGAVSRPTTKKTGKTTISIKSVSGGLVVNGGKVQVSFKKKGKSTKSTTKTVSAGRAAIKVPKLAKGTWKVYVKYLGTTNYARTATTYEGSFKVTK